MFPFPEAEGSIQREVNNYHSTLELEPLTESKVFIWTRENTQKLLDFYKTYRNKVGTLQMRNFKKMWEVISDEFKKLYHLSVTASNCENRWRVLERNYKKFIDNKKQTGAGRNVFANEMEDILGKKKNINPTIVISSETITKPPKKLKTDNSETLESASSMHEKNQDPSENPLEDPIPSSTATNTPTVSKKLIVTPRRYLKTLNKNDSLEKLRLDKENRHKERLLFEKEKFEKLLNLEKEKLATKLERNNLLKENNSLIREKMVY